VPDNPGLSRAGIPRFRLYGEPPQASDERFVHIEAIEDRSRASGWTIDPHVHEDLHQVLLLFSGHVEARADESDRFFLAPAIVIVPAGFVHTFRFRAETYGYVFTVSDQFLRSLNAHQPAFARLFEDARGIRLKPEDVKRYELESTAKVLLREYRAPVHSRTILIEARAQILLAQIARAVAGSGRATCAEASIPRARAEATVEEFRRLIELHFHENWHVKRYAEEMHISVAQLRSSCIKITGNPPIKLLHDRILREAKRSLRYTRRPVTQIAYDLGFHDSAYFSRFFRARSGKAPTEFRRSSWSPPGREDGARTPAWRRSAS